MTWFEHLVGFPEEDPDQVRSQLDWDDHSITSLVNGRSFASGSLEISSLADLRKQSASLRRGGQLHVEQIVDRRASCRERV